MKFCLGAIAIVLASAASAWADQGHLQLSIGNGRVTLIADQVPVRTILAEWARLGQSRIVNAEKVMGAPVTLRLIDVPEEEALDVVLRSASGYLAAPRATPVPNASRFDRIMILATSRPTSAGPPPPAVRQAPAQPFPNFPVAPPMMENMENMEGMDDQVDNDPNDPKPTFQLPAAADLPGPIQVGPAGEEMPDMPPGLEQPVVQPPQLPITAPRPGLIVPPNQPQQPQPPPVRRPGGGDQDQ